MNKTEITPIRLSTAHAARLLDVHPQTVRELVRRGVLTGIRPDGKGGGKRVYVFRDEIELYAETGSADRVRDLRVRKRRLGVRYANVG